MEFRLATMEELPEIKAVFTKLNEHMQNRGIVIWDDFYPCELFKKDIEKERLYILRDEETVLSGFVLCADHDGAKYINWEKPDCPARYFVRFGVNCEHLNKGIGTYMLEKAKETAASLGAEYLRLFAVAENVPALNAYLKSGFSLADGLFVEEIDESCIYRENGLEIKLSGR